MQISISWRPTWLNFLLTINISLYFLGLLFALLFFTQFDRGYGVYLQLAGAVTTDLVVEFGQVWRVIAANFLHALNPLHLTFNMLVLMQVGQLVVEYFGGRWLLVFYVITGVVGNLVSLPFLGIAATVGASGAVFGMMGVLLGASWRRRATSPDLTVNFAEILPLLLVTFAISLWPGTAVNTLAHLGGLAAGVALGYVVPHKLTVQKHRSWDQLEWFLHKLALLSLAITLVCVIISAVNLLSQA